MAQVTADFRIFHAGVDESSVSETDPVKFAEEAAVLKARAAAEAFPSSLVIGADTVVAVKGQILGKPRDRREASAMLHALSGRKHKVISGVALYKKDEDKLLTGYEITRVAFRELTEAMIEDYLSREDYGDKAGSYAIQDVGQAFVAAIQGDYDNVVGFPVRKVRRLLERFQAPEPEVTVEDVALPEGWGVARSQGRVLFIPGGRLGEKLRVRVVKDSKDYSLAQVVKHLEPSPFLTTPACSHFGDCGGCLFQDLAYSRQLELKERHLLQTMKKIGRLEPEGSSLTPITPSPATLHYRNKMEFAFGQEEGRVVLGLRQRASPFGRPLWRTTALARCPIFSPVVDILFPLFLDFARSGRYSIFDRKTGKGWLRNVVLREGKRSGQVMAILVTSSPTFEPEWRGLGRQLLAGGQAIRSFYWGINDQPSDVVQYQSLWLLAGTPAIEESMTGLTFKIYPTTFFQPNPAAAELLYERIARDAGLNGQSRVLSLYCGSGAIEIFLSGRAGRVTGIDSSPDNIAAAQENKVLNNVSNCRFLEGTVEKRLAALQGETFDVLVLDPPRSGLSDKALRQILALAVPTLAYVSCNPATLARDLAAIIRSGYTLGRLASFDFFPHTAHLETLAVLRKT
jgi:23S rRNA (uracil1939-C5)-methyltransferase